METKEPSQSLAGPPLDLKPRMVIRVGVTGHRPEKLPPPDLQGPLRESIRSVLEEIKISTFALFEELKAFYGGDKPILRVVSPLAEGADRLVAEVASNSKLDYEIRCPFPFTQEEYETDFKTPGSRAEFHRLRDLASAVFELDGSRAFQNEAYEAVGRVVLQQSDILIAVWNGKPASGRGGTGQIVEEALVRNIPTIHIKPWSPYRPHLCRTRSTYGLSSPSKPARLSVRLRGILAPPSEPPIGEAHSQAKKVTEQEKIIDFFSDKKPEANTLYKRFRDLVSIRYKTPEYPKTEFEDLNDGTRDQLWGPLTGKNVTVGAYIEENYTRRYKHADGLATAYSDCYRSSFIVTYAFGALAVLSAFCGIYPPKFLGFYPNAHLFWFGVELYLIVAILLLLRRGRRDRWHERWIDYRLLAEALRQMDFLAPLARVTPSFEVPAHLDQDDPSRTWFNWYFRAIVRQAGLIKARINKAYLNTYRKILGGSILHQVKYHGDQGEAKSGALYSRLHRTVVVFFKGTLLACSLHLIPVFIPGYHYHEIVEFLLSFLAIGLPAVGAAIEGIVHQGEFERTSRRSKAMTTRLSEMLRHVSELRPHTTSSQALGQVAEYFCETQLQEHTDWRSLFIPKRLNPP